MDRLGIIGTGNMAEALISGLLAQKTLKPNQITGFDTNTKRLAFMKKKYRMAGATHLANLAKQSQILLLAVKPQQIRAVMTELKPFISPKHLIFSIAAGIPTKVIQQYLGRSQKIVRLMPNTPALIGKGATAFFANKNCKPSDRKKTHTIFKSVGLVFEVKKEGDLDAVTGLSGSGPAYVYSFIDSLVQGGKRVGLSAKIAEQLALQTVVGASLMAQQSELTAQELIAKVASKGGTTEAGLKSLKKSKFDKTIINCVAAATKRAKQLVKG